MTTRTCECGSGESRRALKDGHGIFLTYACGACEEGKIARYRADIMERYHADEPIDDDAAPPDTRVFIDLTPTWEEWARVYSAMAEGGHTESCRILRDELMRMAKIATEAVARARAESE